MESNKFNLLHYEYSVLFDLERNELRFKQATKNTANKYDWESANRNLQIVRDAIVKQTATIEEILAK